MKKRSAVAIICILSALLLISSSFSLLCAANYRKQRELFINDTYFSIKTITEYTQDLDPSNTKAINRIAHEFAILNKACDTQRKYTNGAFYYENPGYFLQISNALSDGKYSESEFSSLHIRLTELLRALSDESGNAENKELTYAQLKRILSDFFQKTDIIPQ